MGKNEENAEHQAPGVESSETPTLLTPGLLSRLLSFPWGMHFLSEGFC